jgi:hypothetical protein
MAEECFDNGDLDSSRQCCRAALGLDPENAKARYYLLLLKNTSGRDAAGAFPVPEPWHPTVPPRLAREE